MSRERPILFSAPMVRAILAGTKTQTRRVVKLPHMNPLGCWEVLPWGGPNGGRTRDGKTVPLQNVIGHSRTGEMLGCPYGEPGDRLWVRETWSPDPPIDSSWASTEWNGCGRRIDGVPERFQHPRFCNYSADWLHGPIVWRPSIHMPRWASRLTLEITGVRVERLQEISEGDAYDEGTAEWCAETQRNGNKWPNIVRAYQGLWESINGRGSWDANPWVWVLEFRKLERQ